MPGPVRRQPPVDPMNLRSMLMLDVARDMMLEPTWAQKSLSVSLVDAANPGERGLTFLGMNHFDGIADVDAGRVDVAVLKPLVVLTMARRGTGPFERPMDLSTIAVMPHHDQPAFAVSDRLGITDLAEIAERRYPLRLSVRGSLDGATYPSRGADVQTVDYSGWPIFCRTDADDALVEQFCRSLEHAKDRIVWNIGPAEQPPLPLKQMVSESPATPFDVPLHPAAKAYWRSVGYLP